MNIITFDVTGNTIPQEWKKNLRRILGNAGRGDVEIVKATGVLRESLENWDGHYALASLFSEHVPDSTSTRLFISAPGVNKYESYCKSLLGHAAWGCCIGQAIAIAYEPKQNILNTQLHETLHLFGVEECYDEKTLKPLQSCTNPKCLMRYDVPSADVCQRVYDQIKI